jgi:hypothetical protein
LVSGAFVLWNCSSLVLLVPGVKGSLELNGLARLLVSRAIRSLSCGCLWNWSLGLTGLWSCDLEGCSTSCTRRRPVMILSSKRPNEHTSVSRPLTAALRHHHTNVLPEGFGLSLYAHVPTQSQLDISRLPNKGIGIFEDTVDRLHVMYAQQPMHSSTTALVPLMSPWTNCGSCKCK